MTARKPFEKAVTPWEIRIFENKPDVRKLLQGEQLKSYTKYHRAFCDYVIGYVDWHGILPTGKEFLVCRRIPENYRDELFNYGDDQYFVNGLLAVAAKMEPEKSDVLIRNIIDISFEQLSDGLHRKKSRGPAGGVAALVTRDDLKRLMTEKLCARVAELRAAPKQGTAPSAPANA